MEVKLYGTNMAGRDYSSYRTAPSAPDQSKPNAAGSIGNYDKLTLHRTQYPTDPKRFARLLAKEAAKEVSRTTNSERVEELRRQVAAGTYVPDADLIARRMLHY